MNHSIIRLSAFVLILATLFACSKKFDTFYERPASLEPPIYQQLQAKGNFTKFVSLIDKAGYKQTLSTAGFWTIFAPTDSAFNSDNAFKSYLSSRNISSVETIDSASAQAIVQYLLVYNAFEKDRIDDYQANTGWLPNNAFKRRTAYYTGFYKDTTPTGDAVVAVASNRNNTGSGTSYYSTSDNNNKYIPFFTSDYFASRGLTSSDYNYFYPNTSFSGFNVVNAKVTQQDIAAENGVIHVIDHVITPLMSLDQYIRTKPEYSEFRKLMEQFMVSFFTNPDATHRYQVLTGKTDNVFVKVFSNLLAYSPNNENFFKLQDNDGQRDGWTMMIPKNDSLLAYENRILSEGYGSLTNLPTQAIADLINSHMWQTSMWPSKFNVTYNFLGEPSHINSTSDIYESKILSNGILYGTNKVNEPNVFSTVYGKSYLNPKMSMTTRLLNLGLRDVITNPNYKFTVFMMPDDVMTREGYSYYSPTNNWMYKTGVNDSNRINLLRILNTAVVETPKGELDNIGQPGFSGIIGTYGGEYIRYNGNQIMTAGTNDKGITVTIDSIKNTKNGKVVYLNNLLYFTYQPVGVHLQTLGTPTTSEFNYFWNYLLNSTAWDNTGKTINGIMAGSFYTIFVPKNAAIKQAVIDGFLPGTVSGTTVTPNFRPTLDADKFKIEQFIQYHILDKRSVIADGKDQGAFPTLLKNDVGDPVYVTIQYPGGVFQLSDAIGRKANLVTSQSNNLSNRTVIHLIDNYLRYR